MNGRSMKTTGFKKRSSIRRDPGNCQAINAKRILTHIEEPDGISHDELKELEKALIDLRIEFAYDTMLVIP